MSHPPAAALFAAQPVAHAHANGLAGTDIILLVVALVLIVLTGVFALSETALTRMSNVKALALADEGRGGAKTLVSLTRRTERVLPVVLFALQVCTLVAATLIGVVANDAFGRLGVVVSTAVEIVIIFVFAELAPKTWAVQHPERAALSTAPVIHALTLFKPLVWVTRTMIALANLVLPGKGIKEGPYVSDEMIRAIADTAVEEDVIQHEEGRLIHEIIAFGDTVVRDVMVPRPDMVSVESRASVADVVDIAIAAGYSRIPVYGQGIDDITGVVLVKDLMSAVRAGQENSSVSGILREATFVPESKKVSELMREMQRTKQHLAVVVDEYGGTAGLVTLEDLIEELVGEIADEYDPVGEAPEELPDNVWVVPARWTIDEVNELLDEHGLSELPEGDWDTIGGLVYGALGHVPAEGELVKFHGHRLVAEAVQGRRIGRVRILGAEKVDAAEGDSLHRRGNGD